MQQHLKGDDCCWMVVFEDKSAEEASYNDLSDAENTSKDTSEDSSVHNAL